MGGRARTISCPLGLGHSCLRQAQSASSGGGGGGACDDHGGGGVHRDFFPRARASSESGRGGACSEEGRGRGARANEPHAVAAFWLRQEQTVLTPGPGRRSLCRSPGRSRSHDVFDEGQTFR